jgi:hypothetical protein
MSVARIIGWISLGALFSSCASFSDLPPRPTYSSLAPLSVHLTTTQKAFLRAGREWIDFASSGLADSAVDAIRESGWVRVAPDDELAPTLELDFAEYQDNGLGLLSLLTAFVVPGTVDHHIALKLSLHDSSEPKSTCSRSADSRTWYQTLLVFVYPFRSPAYERMQASEALALECLAELLEQRDKRLEPALPNTASRIRIE